MQKGECGNTEVEQTAPSAALPYGSLLAGQGPDPSSTQSSK